MRADDGITHANKERRCMDDNIKEVKPTAIFECVQETR
jgi:hypothetical protein